MEAPKDHEMVLVVPGVPGGDVPEQTTIHSYKLVRPVPQLPPVVEHVPHLPILSPVFAVWEEVNGHVLQPGSCNGSHSNLSLAVLL